MKNFTILERSGDPFEDRAQAGQELARALGKIDTKKIVVLGIPRGGVVVAQYLARELNASLDIILARKIGAPADPEFAIGAVSEDGHAFLNQEYARRAGAEARRISKKKKAPNGRDQAPRRDIPQSPSQNFLKRPYRDRH